MQSEEIDPKCVWCNGTGYLLSGFVNLGHECKKCHGTGFKHKGIEEDCPRCGAEMEAELEFGDGDLATCAECGFKSGISVDEDGSYWLQES